MSLVNQMKRTKKKRLIGQILFENKERGLMTYMCVFVFIPETKFIPVVVKYYLQKPCLFITIRVLPLKSLLSCYLHFIYYTYDSYTKFCCCCCCCCFSLVLITYRFVVRKILKRKQTVNLFCLAFEKWR